MTPNRVEELTRLMNAPSTPTDKVIDYAVEIANIALDLDPDEPPLRDQLAALEAELAALKAAPARPSAGATKPAPPKGAA